MEHAINFGDIGRILETILLVLLDPSTSRIAIHYISVQDEKKKKSSKSKTHTISNYTTKQRNNHSSSSSKQKKASLVARQQSKNGEKSSLDNKGDGSDNGKEMKGNQAATITTDDAEAENEEDGGANQEENNEKERVEGSSGAGDQDETTISKSRTQSEVSSSGFADDEEDDIDDGDDQDEDDDDDDQDSDVSDDDVTVAIENSRKGLYTFESLDFSCFIYVYLFVVTVEYRLFANLQRNRILILKFKNSEDDFTIILKFFFYNNNTSGNERLTTNSSHHSTNEKPKHKTRQKTPTHPLLIHKLLYTQRYDHQQCLYALSLVSTVLKDEGRAFICSAATTSMSVCNTPHQSLLRELLIRHRRALSGNEFYGSLADGKSIQNLFIPVGLSIKDPKNYSHSKSSTYPSVCGFDL